ncbi:response regulator transcription factor [Actinospongicola halichondriae]|uniref:response regulator transcription factor n=1 Tax=Actinospongicola halichondriae TaxID=3236844 RepID=UPI003D37D95F
MTSLLIADDEEDMRLLLRMVIRVANDGLEVTGEATTGSEAVQQALEATAPHDVIVLDNRMPVMSGLEAAVAILERRPDQPIILYSAHLDDAVRADAEAVGIRACLRKSEIEQLPELVRSLAAA